MRLKHLGIIFLSIYSAFGFAEIDCAEDYSYDKNSKSCVKFLTSDSERKKGLMFKKELKPNHQLHFLWKDEQLRCMWMKNTSIPIDILFIDQDMKLVLEKGIPYSKERICHKAIIVVEANRGELSKKFGLNYQ